MVDLSLGVILGLISLVGFGLADAILKKPAQKIGGIFTIFWRQIFLVPFLILSLPFFLIPSFEWGDLGVAILLGVVGYIPFWAFMKAITRGKVGVIVPIAASSVIFTVLFSMIFYQETISWLQAISIVAIVCGVVLLTLRESDWKKTNVLDWETGIPFAIIASIGWGLIYFLFRIPAESLGVGLAALTNEVVILLISGIHLLILRESFSFPHREWKSVASAAVVVGFGTLAYFLGITLAAVSIVAPLNAGYPLVATLYGSLVYREKLVLRQWTGVLVVIVGLVFLTLFSSG